MKKHSPLKRTVGGPKTAFEYTGFGTYRKLSSAGIGISNSVALRSGDSNANFRASSLLEMIPAAKAKIKNSATHCFTDHRRKNLRLGMSKSKLHPEGFLECDRSLTSGDRPRSGSIGDTPTGMSTTTTTTTIEWGWVKETCTSDRPF